MTRSRPLYGIADESAKIHVLRADVSVLGRLPGVTPQLAAEIVRLRQAGEIRCINDLLRVEGIDTQLLYGADASGNGLLIPPWNGGNPAGIPQDAEGHPDRGSPHT